MRRIILAFVLQIPILVFAQNNFSLNGELKNSDGPKNIYLIHVEDQREKLDSAKVINGKFDFNIKLEKPSIAILLLDHTGNDLTDKQGKKDVYRFFIEPGKASLNSSDSVSKSKVEGLPIFKVHETLIKTTLPAEEQLLALNKEFMTYSESKRRNPDFSQGFQDKYEQLLDQRQSSIASFIQKNPDSYVSLYALNGDLAIDNMNVELVENTYKVISDRLKQDPIAIAVKAKLDLEKKFGIGAVAPDFEEKTAEQISIKLSSFKGQYVLVDFWASWCAPCRQENPNVLRAYETFKDKNFTVLGVSIDEREDLWIKAVKADGLVWTQILDRSQAIAIDYGISSIPRNFLLDPEGKIIAKNLRGPELLDKLKEVLKGK
ncbi:MAG: TlpA disulfide reductase family protein [Pelobium sp.]